MHGLYNLCIKLSSEVDCPTESDVIPDYSDAVEASLSEAAVAV